MDENRLDQNELDEKWVYPIVYRKQTTYDEYFRFIIREKEKFYFYFIKIIFDGMKIGTNNREK